MSGKRSGVAKQIEEEEPKAYTYCYGHALNIAAGDTTKACTTLKNALDITLEITKLVKLSPRRDAIFLRLKEQLQCSAPGIRILFPTRWTVRADSIKNVLDNYFVLRELCKRHLEIVFDSEMRAKISGVALLMERFDFFFGICLRRVLFRHTDNLSKALQKKDVSPSEGDSPWQVW